MAALSGMTGFGRSGGEAPWGRWAWEAKSVNGRNLDVRVGFPGGLDPLEPLVKAAAAERFQRGNLQVSLRIDLAAGARSPVDEAALDALCAAYRARTGEVPAGAALAALMATRPVLDGGAQAADVFRSLAADVAAMEALAGGAAAALDELAASRLAEGRSLKRVLSDLLHHLETLRLAAAAQGTTQPGLLRERLQARLREIGAEGAVDADRLAAEVAIAAARADVREELDRLAAHIATGRGYLAAGSPAGRKLDFLAQELNREANTLCSKSASLGLTEAGLGLKAGIDQFKEQAANVE